MTDRPIIFSGPMVRALLEGRKTQTRRVLRPQPPEGLMPECMAVAGEAQPIGAGYARGDRLWVREAWCVDDDNHHHYKASSYVPPRVGAMATSRGESGQSLARWRSPIHMPRWASRLTLVVTDVRVQRLQEISEADALAEGIERVDPTVEDEEWNRSWCDEKGIEPEPMKPVWVAPGTRQGFGSRKDDPQWAPTPELAFGLLWDSINAKRGHGWADNPWVCAITFTVHHCNIDAMTEAT